MKTIPLTDRLGVCSWSLRPANPGALLASLKETGLSRIQLALDPLRENPAVWGGAPALLRGQGVSIVSGMFGCVGEDYSTLDTIRATGGLLPDATWEQNWANIQATAQLAQRLELKLVGFHAGFLPHDPADPRTAIMQERVRRVAGLFHDAGILVALETGQETAATLAEFLAKLKCSNVKVNFDPANMILYDKGDPIEALRVLGPWIGQTHIKDARRTRVPGTWGDEVVVGTGQVDWKAFFATLDSFGFRGDCCIEREAGENRAGDIRSAREFLGRLPR